MSKAMTIARRELGAFFTSPVFWALATAFMAFTGYVFAVYVPQAQQATMEPLLALYSTIMLFVTPLLAMRLLSEEQRSGTMELLMTSPVRDWQVVLGKWLAAFVVFAVLMALTLFHTGIMARLATRGMETGPLIGGYLGLLLLGAALMALGVLTSSLTENQVVAAFLGIMLVMLLWFLPIIADQPGNDGAVYSALRYIGLSEHFGNFGQGVIDSRDVMYFLSLTIGALFVATRVLETRRWR